MFESFGIAFHNFDAVYLHDLKLEVVDFKIVSFTFQASQCWRAALEFTTRFLTAHGQGVGQTGQRALHTHKTLQVQNRKLFLTSWYATVKFHMGLVKPWFVFCQFTTTPKSRRQDQMTLICLRSKPESRVVSKKMSPG